MLQRAPEQTRARAQRPSTSTSAPTAPPVRTLTRTPSRSRAWRSNGDHAHTHTTPRTRWTHLPGLREAHAHPRKHTCTSDLTRSHHPCSPRMLACAHAPTCSHTDTRKRTHTARNARRPHNFPAVLPGGGDDTVRGCLRPVRHDFSTESRRNFCRVYRSQNPER